MDVNELLRSGWSLTSCGRDSHQFFSSSSQGIKLSFIFDDAWIQVLRKLCWDSGGIKFESSVDTDGFKDKFTSVDNDGSKDKLTSVDTDGSEDKLTRDMLRRSLFKVDSVGNERHFWQIKLNGFNL